MIITQIIGGLGNQMFQYAAGRALSLRTGTDLALDISSFKNYGLHQGFELQSVFEGPFGIASKVDFRDVLGWQSSAWIRRISSRRPFANFAKGRFIAEPHFQFWPGINSLSKDCYLSGYWQSEKYFAAFAEQIRADFTFRQPLNGQNSELARHVEMVNSVSLHVRRGDYATNPKTTATHGLCSLDYYQDAIRHFEELVQQPLFFIFSDDIEWVKSNLDVGLKCVYVQNNTGAGSYNDMRLMSLCKHHIIANSSFSWWGAWLDANQKKIVVAPKKWFANNNDTRDLFPNRWLLL